MVDEKGPDDKLVCVSLRDPYANGPLQQIPLSRLGVLS
jgi:hypothetical protein